MLNVSNRSKDIISFIIKVCRWFVLNNKILNFHDLFTLQNQLISNSHCLTYYNKLLYMCGGEGYCVLLVNFADLLFIVRMQFCYFMYIHSRNERERGIHIQRNI